MGVGLRRRTAALAVLAALALAAGACGGEQTPSGGGSTSAAPAPERTQADRPSRPAARQPAEPPAPPACIDDGAACVRASGRILYVERVDPDGDGDAHFVTSSGDSVTAPGVTVFDVRAELRPDPLPGPGDAISASGPVLEGSYGQRQIEADAVSVSYAR